MGPDGLIAEIIACVANIAMGRKCFMIDGREHEGRLFYEDGIFSASECFKAALATADLQALVQADYTYSEQEYQFCDLADKYALSSLTATLRGFKDALTSLEIVKDSGKYKIADKTYSTAPEKRIHGCPLDVFHQTCKSHITRLRNSLRTPGINMTEKSVLNQRIANMRASQAAYLRLQMAALLKQPGNR
jgi:hypothetical protein